MTDQQESRAHFEAFLESSSLLAHDVSGQTHVAQFCADEMRQELIELGAESKFIQRLQESLTQLSELTVLYRQFVKDHDTKNDLRLFRQAHLLSSRALSLHYFKDRERLRFDVAPELLDLECHTPNLSIQQVLYAVYSLCLEGLKKERVEKSVLKIEQIGPDFEDGPARLLLSNQHGQLERDKILKSSEEESTFTGKTLRRTNCLVTFKKALQGQLTAVKISFDQKYVQGLVLEVGVNRPQK